MIGDTAAAPSGKALAREPSGTAKPKEKSPGQRADRPGLSWVDLERWS